MQKIVLQVSSTMESLAKNAQITIGQQAVKLLASHVKNALSAMQPTDNVPNVHQENN